MSQAWNEIQLFLRRHLSPGVMWIFLINIALFILYMLLTPFSKSLQVLFFLLMQTPKLTIESFFIWQPVTYMFMHADLLHLLFNMIILWFFASRLEDRWGTKRFLRFYFIVGIGAAFFHIMLSYLTGHKSSTMLGASGALYGIMLAYALNWPDDIVLLYFVIPIKIKYLMLIAGILTFMGSVQSAMNLATDNISHVTHLGGLLVAFIYLRAGRWFGGGRPGGGGGSGRFGRGEAKRRSGRPTIIQVDPRTHPDYKR